MDSKQQDVPPDSEVGSVTLYEWRDGYDSSRPIEVGSAEREEVVNERDRKRLGKLDSEVARAIFSIWTPTFTATWDESFVPSAVKVGQRWLIKDSGGTQWIVVFATSLVVGTKWRCLCVELLGEPVVK